jgi:two-component system NtrC family sensor kinase
VTDTGSGIALDAQRRLLTPLFTTKPAGIGTGLGLSVCHRIEATAKGE